jgi:hypothetical protein
LAIRWIAATTAVVAACALPFAPPAHSQIGAVPVPDSPCNLPTARTFIVWQRVPGMPDSSNVINESDLYNCQPTLDTWHAAQPTGAGYCTKIAWSSDNPAYSIAVWPALPLKKVFDQVGDCGNT